MAPHTADELALECAAGFLGRASLLLAPGEVRPGGDVTARLDDGDVVQQAVEPAVPQAVQAVAHPTGAGRLKRGDAGERGELGDTETGPWRPKLRNEYGGHEWTDTLDGGQGGEVVGDGALDAPAHPPDPTAPRLRSGTRDRA